MIKVRKTKLKQKCLQNSIYKIALSVSEEIKLKFIFKWIWQLSVKF